MIRDFLDEDFSQYAENDERNDIKERLPFFSIIIIVWVLVFFFVVILLPIIGNEPQIYNDMIIETTAKSNTNKSGELNIFWIALLLSSAGIVGITHFIKYINKDKIYSDERNIILNKWHVFKFICISLIPNIILLLFTGNIEPHLLFVTSAYCIVDIFYEKFSFKIVLLFAFLFYSSTGIIAILNKILSITPILEKVVKNPKISFTQLRIIVLFIGAIVLIYCINKGKETLLNRILILLQFIIPLNLMIYLIDTYKLPDDTIVRTKFDIGYILFIYLIIAALFIYIFFKFKLLSKKIDNISSKDLIFLSSIITIFIFNSYLLPAQFFQIDGRHHGEQMMAWNQIVKQGSFPYEFFYPSSGLYSMVTGFIQNILLNGSVTVYAAAESLVMVIFAIITITLCYFNAGSVIALVISIFFSIPVYNRAYMVLPSLFLLSMPSIIKKKNIWLQLYLILFILSYLYYPLYGVALFLGGIPFAYSNLFYFIKSGELKASYKKPKFLLSWGIILISIIICIPILLGILKYTGTASSQTVLADGIAVFSGLKNVPPEFFPYMSNQLICLILYYGMRLTIPIAFVFVMVLILYLYLANKNYDLSEKLQKPVYFGLTSSLIATIFSYTYTIVRADVSTFMSRDAITIVTISIFLIVILYKYGSLILSKAKAYILIGILLGFSILIYRISFIENFPNVVGSVSSNGGFTDDTLKLNAFYNVPKNFILSDGDIPSIGKGYVPKDLKKNYLSTSERIKSLNLEGDYILNLGLYQDYSLHNVKALDTGLTSLSKSKKSQERVIELMKEKRPAIGQLDSYMNYYIYSFIIKEGYVRTTKGFYMPPQKVKEKDIVQGWKFTDDTFSKSDVGNIPNSLGKSMNSLNKMFTKYNLENGFDINCNNLKKNKDEYIIENTENAYIEINFNKKIKGLNADFLYLELDTDASLSSKKSESKLIDYFTKNTLGENYQIAIYWTNGKTPINNNKMFKCNYGDGHLLINLGANPRWLLEENDKIQIHFLEQFKVGSNIKINDMQLLKLN